MSDISGINVGGTTYTLADSTARSSIPTASSSTPSPLGTAAAGTSTAYARADHVHAKPTASDIGAYTKPSGGIPKTDLASAVQTSLGKADGAIPAPASPATGAFLVWNGSAWVAQTLATWQGGAY